MKSTYHPFRMNTLLPTALIGALALFTSTSHAEDINLLCAGTYFLYQGKGAPQEASTDSVIIKLDDVKKTIRIAGTLQENASGPMNITDGHYWAVLPHANEAQGVRYAYIGVNVNRLTGETVILSLTKPSFEGAGVMYFNGKCAPSKRLF